MLFLVIDYFTVIYTRFVLHLRHPFKVAKLKADSLKENMLNMFKYMQYMYMKIYEK